MNALKKAESAKQAGESAPAEPALPAAAVTGRNLTQELGLDPPATRNATAATGPSFDTAPSKPDPVPLLRPMELALEPDLAPQVPQVPPPAPPARVAAGAASGRGRSAPDTGRSGARAVFSAKQPASANSRAPFYSVIGLCLAGGAAYGVYLWMQMQPPPRPAVAAASVPQNRPIGNPPDTTTAATTANSATAPPPAADTQPSAGAGNAMSEAAASNLAGAGAAGTPERPVRGGDVPEQSARAGDASAPLARRDAAPPQSALPRSSRPADAASAAGGAMVESPANLRITRNTNAPVVHPDVLAGYAALQSGDLDRAGQAYDRALRSEPANRDALLGAATVLLRLDRTDAAEAYFRQVLRLHPHDTYATAQLAALTARSDPVGALSQVNSLIAREADRPESGSGQGSLAFVQGNQLAAQSRWPEAQQAYFNAHRADPGNADYCYNLAVSLDRMHEPRLARDFYSKAIDLARSRPAGFDLARAKTRLSQIEGALK